MRGVGATPPPDMEGDCVMCGVRLAAAVGQAYTSALPGVVLRLRSMDMIVFECGVCSCVKIVIYVVRLLV